MNRLIIIGNGFDIAHGMPTRYSDFVKWYLTTLFKKLGKEDFEDDGIRGLRNRQSSSLKFESSEKLIKFIETTIETPNKYLQTILNNQFVEFPSNNTQPFLLILNIPF
jgi:TPP-dependent 2-oxoacid decarboxylase